jgi:hypothetical protein
MSVDEASLGIDADVPLHEKAAASFALKLDGKGDMGSVTLPGQRSKMKELRPPRFIIELLHQGTLAGTGEDQQRRQKSQCEALISVSHDGLSAIEPR